MELSSSFLSVAIIIFIILVVILVLLVIIYKKMMQLTPKKSLEQFETDVKYINNLNKISNDNLDTLEEETNNEELENDSETEESN